MNDIFDVEPRPRTLVEAIAQTVGYASTCWENMSGTGVFQTDQARDAVTSLENYLRNQMNPDVLAEVFKDAWGEADRAGREGHRTEAGIAAVIAKIFGEKPDDSGQPHLFDCD